MTNQPAQDNAPEENKNPTDETLETPETQEAEAPENSEPSAEDIIAAKDAEIAELKDKLLRAAAELQNTQRRSKQQVEDAGKYYLSKFAQDLITVQENLYLALGHFPKDNLETDEALKNVFDGIELTRSDLEKTFTNAAIKRIDPKGDKFDPHLHQAVANVPDETNEAGTIIDVIQAGYMIHDRLLRPAMVVVAKKPE